MASITKKPNGTWLAQVRRAARDGAPAVNKSASFPRKAEAQAWAEKTEVEWRAFRAGITPAVPFADVLKRYSQYALFLIRRWLALPYYAYCLRLAALYEK